MVSAGTIQSLDACFRHRHRRRSWIIQCRNSPPRSVGPIITHPRSLSSLPSVESHFFFLLPSCFVFFVCGLPSCGSEIHPSHPSIDQSIHTSHHLGSDGCLETHNDDAEEEEVVVIKSLLLILFLALPAAAADACPLDVIRRPLDGGEEAFIDSVSVFIVVFRCVSSCGHP